MNLINSFLMESKEPKELLAGKGGFIGFRLDS